MSDPLKSHLPDADMQAVPGALLRAAQRAREVARRTGTAIVVLREGKIVEEDPDAVEDSLSSKPL